MPKCTESLKPPAAANGAKLQHQVSFAGQHLNNKKTKRKAFRASEGMEGVTDS